MPGIYRLFLSFLLASNARSIPVEHLELEGLVPRELGGNPGNAAIIATRRTEHNGTETQRNTTPNTINLTVINTTEIIPLNASVPTLAPVELEGIPSSNEAASIGNLTGPKSEVSISGTKEGQYVPPSTFYTFKVVCPSLPEILGDGPDHNRRMSQDPKQYRSFSSTPKTRPSATENLESAGIFFKVLLGVCLECAECDPQTGQLKTLPPSRCKSAETVGRCSNWLNCYCEVEMKDFINREDISDEEARDIYRTLDGIPNWIKRKHPNHRFVTLDGLSLAWQRDGWSRPHPLPVGTIWRGEVYDPDGPGPEFAPDTAEPFPLYGPGPSEPQRDYRWLVSGGPGLLGIGGNSNFKRDNVGGGDDGDARENHQEWGAEKIP